MTRRAISGHRSLFDRVYIQHLSFRCSDSGLPHIFAAPLFIGHFTAHQIDKKASEQLPHLRIFWQAMESYLKIQRDMTFPFRLRGVTLTIIPHRA